MGTLLSRRVLYGPDGLPVRASAFAEDVEWALFDVTQEQVGLLAINDAGGRTRARAERPLSPIVDVYACENATTRDPLHHWAIGRAQYVEATEWAKDHGLVIVGQIHTHVQDGPEPSLKDVDSLPRGGLGAVWHLKTGRLTWFTKNRVVGSETLHPVSWVNRWMARLYCS